MRLHKHLKRTGTAVFALAALGAFALFAPDAAAQEETPVPAKQEFSIEWGFNLADVNGERPAKFFQGQSVPQGLVLPSLRLNLAGRDFKTYFQLESRDGMRADERVGARFDVNGLLAGRFQWNRIPWVHGNGAVSLLSQPGSSVQRQSAGVQMTLEDPDGDGIPGTEADNDLVPGFVRDLFSSATPFSLESKRRTGSVALTFTPARNWAVDLSFSDERRSGMRAMGSGTYDRLTFTPPSGTGQDEYFFIRGTELARPIDFTTRIFSLGTSYAWNWGYAQGGLEWSKFENGATSLTYSNPIWHTDTYSAAAPPGIYRGWSRGLWNEGRYALEPGNNGFTFHLGGGVTLPRSTRLNVSFAHGSVKQNEPLLPYTANSALDGRVDLNQDGVVGGQDLGTDVSTLPYRSLNGEAVSTSLHIRLSSRPIKALQINVRVPYFHYENKHGHLSFPFRADYMESAWKNGIQNITPVLTELTDHSSKGIYAEGIIRPAGILSVRVFGETRTREYEEREVRSTSTKTLGVGLSLNPLSWLDARFSYADVNRTFKGDYVTKYSGEQQGLRMFDIARVDRHVLQCDLGVAVGERAHLGANLRSYRDTYPESSFGLQKTRTFGYGADASYAFSDRGSVFLYADLESYDFEGHGDTKMGAFNRPGNDWFYEVADETLSLGAGVNVVLIPGRFTLDVNGYLVDGNVASLNRNPSDVLYSPLAASAVSFPDQETKLTGMKLQLVHKLTDRLSVGVNYWYERFRLSDYAWDSLNPYGYDFLSVDNALRYLFLDSRYGSYTANVGQFFFRYGF